MQTKHTGPWHLNHYTIKRQDGRVLAKCNIEHNDEQEANARLIAAAPDLLATCKRLLADITNIDADERTDLERWVLTQLSSVIDKAEGRE